ncbi:MAG TPA: A/G-specific adenine glycosylase [Tepidisphaeraceae bacterium]|nr:A/G-specific adenine glycosylase [Tepidisphaeraceae bacterium]
MLLPGPQFTRRLLRWYDRARRDLPWRIDPASGEALDPWHVLVSETMLQQTQAATVTPFYRRFLARFPTVAGLAGADEQEALRLWQGLGYYSRARNLRAAARKIVGEFGGNVPADVEQLLSLPGVGRYTAGAVASIAFGRRVPILDGNVQRVLCRLDRIESDPREPATRALLWQRAAEILPKSRVGDFNSALMELGATLCMPRAPRCLLCPVRGHCEAFAAGVQERIPVPRKAKPTPLIRRQTYCICREDCWLIEQRPAKGRWAGMWQFVTLPHAEKVSSKEKPRLPLETTPPRLLGALRHALTHRRYQFEVMACEAKGDGPLAADKPRRWLPLDRLHEVPMPRPHQRIAEMLREKDATTCAGAPAQTSLKIRNPKHEIRNKPK